MNKTIVITGNHHTPALELIRQLQSDKWNIHYIADASAQNTHLNHLIIPQLKDHFHPLKSGKLDRFQFQNTLIGIPQTIKAIFTAKSLLCQINPDITVSFGGYSSVPVIIASKLLHIPSITHEQTPTLSLSTKINSLFANQVALSFPLDNAKNKFKLTGNLLRHQIYQTKSAKFQHLNQLIKKYPLIYITGGSQGSRYLNQTVKKILPNLTSAYTIIHQTGNRSRLQPSKNYFPLPYIQPQDIGWVLNHASMVIGRSGANFCQEIVALGKSAILIPLLKSQQNEQIKNALWVQHKLPQTTIIYQQDLRPAVLSLAIANQPLSPPSPSPKQSVNHRFLKLIYSQID